MEISSEVIDNLGKLSRLELSADEKIHLKKDLTSIVGFFQQLDQVDTSGLAEMARPVEISNRLRKDESRPSLTQEEALSVAIEQEAGNFKVPRVLE